jgi:hypothetical protein
VTDQPGPDEHGHAPGLFPVPGDGVLARRGDLILLCGLEDSQTADGLLDLLEQLAAARGDGRQFTDAIADALDTAEATQSVLAFGPSGAGLAVTVSGGAWAELRTSEGTFRIEAGHPSMQLRCILRSPVTGVDGGLSPDDKGVASTDRFSRLDAGIVRAGGLSYYQVGGAGEQLPGGPGAGDVRLGKGGEPRATPVQTPAARARLAGVPVAQVPPQEAGVPQAQAEPPAQQPQRPVTPAPAGPEVSARARQSEPTAAWVAPEMPAPASAAGVQQEVTAAPEPFEPAQPFEAVLLHGAGPGGAVDLPARPPLSKVKDMPPGTSSYVSAGPIIQGVYCKNGHFDDPEALFCAICGISMNQQTLVPRPGERPPLGVLLLDDGSVFQLDTDYVVGREPGLDSAVASGKARPLRISDDSGIVSRVHARVHLDGWRVLVTDLGSANGTRVILPGHPGDQPLVPQVPLVLATGSRVDLGGRGFRYESHRGR